MSKKVVNDFWKTLIKERNLTIFSIETKPKDLLQKILLQDKKIKPARALNLCGLYFLARDQNGIRELRTIFSKRSDSRTWYRVSKDIKYLNELITENNLRDWVKQIDQGLETYKVYKVKNYDRKE